MKRIHILSYSLTAVALASTLFLGSCSDALDITPTEQITSKNFYKTDAQMDQALTGVYSRLLVIPQYLFTMSEVKSDNIYVGADNKLSDIVNNATLNSAGIKTEAENLNCWANLFKVVVAANIVLDKIDAVNFAQSPEAKVQYKAEARMLRAYAYFLLAQLYGNVPLATTQVSVEEAFQLKQSGQKDIYEKVIIPDLLYAVENLAEKPFNYKGADNTGHVTRLAAKALLGKVYLTMAGFPLEQTDKKELAIPLFKEVIDKAYNDGNGTAWTKNIDEWNAMWVHENDDKYFLWEIEYAISNGLGNPVTPVSVSSNIGVKWCTDGLTTGVHTYIEHNLQMHYFRQDDEGNYEVEDLRAPFTFNLQETVDDEGNTIIGTGNTFYTKMFEHRMKRASLGLSDMDAQILTRTYWPQNFPILRVEDIMLLYAECVGGTSEGYKMLNAIRQRAGLPAYSGLSAKAFDEAVQNERRYELAEEGHRWFDLVRRNEYQEKLRAMFTSYGELSLLSRVNKNIYLYPIPQAQMEIREGLYQQNPGY